MSGVTTIPVKVKHGSEFRRFDMPATVHGGVTQLPADAYDQTCHRLQTMLGVHQVRLGRYDSDSDLVHITSLDELNHAVNNGREAGGTLKLCTVLPDNVVTPANTTNHTNNNDNNNDSNIAVADNTDEVGDAERGGHPDMECVSEAGPPVAYAVKVHLVSVEKLLVTGAKNRPDVVVNMTVEGKTHNSSIAMSTVEEMQRDGDGDRAWYNATWNEDIFYETYHDEIPLLNVQIEDHFLFKKNKVLAEGSFSVFEAGRAPPVPHVRVCEQKLPIDKREGTVVTIKVEIQPIDAAGLAHLIAENERAEAEAKAKRKERKKKMIKAAKAAGQAAVGVGGLAIGVMQLVGKKT